MPSGVRTIDVEGTASAYYAPATTTSSKDLIHIAGQPGISRLGLLPSDYESQIHLALLNLARILTAAKTSVTDILKLTMYIVNYDPTKRKHTRIVQRFLGKHRPAVTLVPVSQLAVPGWLFEIDAVVARSTAEAPRFLSSTEKVDVVIIGAGLAGLTAAQRIVEAGYTCKILEANDRVGGRTWSQKLSSGGVLDIGAAWINDTNQTRMIGLARQFNAELIEQNVKGNVILQEDGSKDMKQFPYGGLPGFPEDIKNHLAQVRDAVEADCQALDVNSTSDSHSAELDSMTFLAYILQKLGANAEAIATATIWTRAMLGQDPSDISALFFLHYCKAGGGLMQMRSDGKGGGQALRVRQGTQMFALNIAKTLQDIIEFNTPVRSIDHSRVNQYQARKVICAIPPPVVKSITFTPELPPAKKLLLDSYKYGYYQKVMVIFKSPFWIETGSCGLVQSFVGPAAVIRDTSIHADGKYVFTCFVAGSIGQAWSELPEQERQETILRQIEGVFGDIARHEYVEMVGHQWNDEQWTGYGCPSPSTAPGVLSAVGHELKTVAGDVHFAGTETSDVWRGYMEGAVLSGEREAKLVLSALKGVEARL